MSNWNNNGFSNWNNWYNQNNDHGYWNFKKIRNKFRNNRCQDLLPYCQVSKWSRCFNKVTGYILTKMRSVAVLLCVCVAHTYGEVAIQYKDVILNKHNEFRRLQKATDMNALAWNDTLAEIADRWTRNCRFEHESKGYGENLAYSTNKDTVVKTGLDDWYNEIKDYSYNTKSCSGVCTHYTQVVWAKSTQVGCALTHCPSLYAFGGTLDAMYFACWYSPRGNYGGEEPFHKAKGREHECDDCWEGQTCVNGLCVGVGKEKCVDLEKDCKMWSLSNQCTANRDYMERKCRKSCKFCVGDDEGEPANLKDVSPDCSRYGCNQCSANPAWMIPNCEKFCSTC
ncbi:GLI pathoproteinsis-related 1 like 1 [Mactra antiquata]